MRLAQRLSSRRRRARWLLLFVQDHSNREKHQTRVIALSERNKRFATRKRTAEFHHDGLQNFTTSTTVKQNMQTPRS